MAQKFFVNFPVADVAKATAFYEAIGCTKNEQFSNERSSAMLWSDEVAFMLLSKDFFATLTPKQIADPRTSTTALFALSCDSRADVDALTAKAIAAGGREAHDAEDMGFMYSRAFEDLDGNGFGPFHMDVEAMAGMDQCEPVDA